MPPDLYLLPVGNAGGNGNGNLLSLNLKYASVRCCGLFQGHLQGCLQVAASLLSAETAAKELLEKVAEPAAVPGTAAEITEPLEGPEPLRAATVRVRIASLCLVLLAVPPVLAILVIPLALLAVAKHLVGLVNLLEFLLCLRVVLVKVGVVLLCQSAVCLLYLLLRGVPFHSQNLVVIDECHNPVFLLKNKHRFRRVAK